LAILLMALFSFSLISPAGGLASDAESKLPGVLPTREGKASLRG